MKTSAIDDKSFDRILLKNIMLPVGVMALIALTFVGLVFYLLSINRWIEHSEQVIGRSNQLMKLIVDSETGLRGYLLTGKENFLEPYDLSRVKLRSTVSELTELLGDNPSQKLHLEDALTFYRVWVEYAQTRIDKKRAGVQNDVLSSEHGKEMMDEIRHKVTDFTEQEELLRTQRKKHGNDASLALVIIVLTLSSICAFIVASSGKKQLLKLSESYGGLLETQREQTESLQKKDWLRSGEILLAAKIRGENTLQVLAKQVLDFIVQYVGANVGIFYASDGKEYFKAEAFHAVSSPEQKNLGYSLGEAQIGQAAMSLEPVLLQNISDKKMEVLSGLTQSSSSSILLFPFGTAGVCYGVLELGFLAEISAGKKEFLNQISEALAISVKTCLFREKLQDLLNETQSQAEELEAQQEELSAANEELRQKGEELSAQQNSLESSNQELAQQQKSLREQKKNLEEANQKLLATQKQLEEKAKGLITANRYKSEFLANMSHELRTPLNSILILAKLLSENPQNRLDKEQVQFADTIHDAATDLLTLINDILDLSKVEAGRINVHQESVSLAGLATNLSRSFQPLLAKKGLKFAVEVDPLAPAVLQTDRLRIEQILRNFISNAYKFTEKGSITVRMSPTDQRNDEGKPYSVEFSVTDTGIGIPKDKQELIFEAFNQVDGTISRKYGGTGLGLTISKQFATLLGGKIELTSELDQGTTLKLFLSDLTGSLKSNSYERIEPSVPLPAVEPPTTIPASSLKDDRHLVSEEKKSVLIIEDDSRFRDILYRLCRGKGFQCILSPDGESGLKDAAYFKPNAILLDIQLPRVSGVSVLEQLKRNPTTRHIPVHVISVDNRETEVLKMGAVDFLSKPASKGDLDKILETIESELKPGPKRVLVVEDNQIERDNIIRLIGNDDIEIVGVGSGEVALQKLNQEKFNCMILDLKLPDTTGVDLLKKIRDDQSINCPPVIIYTAKDVTPTEQLQLDELSHSIIIKGAKSPERLIDEITLFLHQVEERLPPEKREMLERIRHREETFEGKKLLLVDDDMRNVFALRTFLSKKGFSVFVSRNGKEALTRLGEEAKIDVILMDLMMPEMDGFETMRKIRSDSRYAKVPMLALTAKAMKGDREKSLAAGASDYLAKPIEVSALLSLLRVWLT